MYASVSTPLQEENERLKHAVEELSILNDLARAIGASTNSEEMMQTLIRRSLKAVHAEQGVITLVERQANEPAKTLVRAMVSSSDHLQFHVNQALVGWMQLNKKPLLVHDPKNDQRFHGVRWETAVHSILCVPLLVKSELKGVLTVYNKKDGKRFDPDDQRLLAIIAGQSAQVVDNARLYEEEKMFMKMQEELRLAAKIQIDLLPKASLCIPNYEIVGRMLPAQTVGGDYFDFIPLDKQRLAICLGDVSGKGMPASLLMANLQATLRSYAFTYSSPSDCLAHSNKLLFMSTSPEKFATLFYSILDTHAHTLTFSNAGHEPPFVTSADGAVRRLVEGGIPLGFFEEFHFEEGSIPLKLGDTVVIYSDGISEAMNADQEQYHDHRVQALLLLHAQSSAEKLLNVLISDVNLHRGSLPQQDDITIVVIKRTS